MLKSWAGLYRYLFNARSFQVPQHRINRIFQTYQQVISSPHERNQGRAVGFLDATEESSDQAAAG